MAVTKGDIYHFVLEAKEENKFKKIQEDTVKTYDRGQNKTQLNMHTYMNYTILYCICIILLLNMFPWQQLIFVFLK